MNIDSKRTNIEAIYSDQVTKIANLVLREVYIDIIEKG
jgi:hypothetical protein